MACKRSNFKKHGGSKKFLIFIKTRFKTKPTSLFIFKTINTLSLFFKTKIPDSKCKNPLGRVPKAPKMGIRSLKLLF